ncbi:hypothetical protein [Hydrogenophaga sp. ANAO-22]|uniref:hypothetical protein n=1 Tax=Hydrogenophaga sp. ANAO-22 TaxID=3166645 RepID=UPI0036D3BE99
MAPVKFLKSLLVAASVVVAQAIPTLFGLETELRWAALGTTLVAVLATLLLASVDPPNPRQLHSRFRSASRIVVGVFGLAFIYYFGLFYYHLDGKVPPPVALYLGIAAYAIIVAGVAAALAYFVCLRLKR